MATKQMEPDVDPRREREQREHAANRNKKVAAFAVAAAIGLVACSGSVGTPRVENAAAPGPAEAPETTAKELATSFLEAYGAFDADRAITYLADDADLSGLGLGGTRQFRLLLSFLEAQGYKQMLTPCEETGSSSAGTYVRCGFDFHAIRSDEVGRGPFSGSFFDLTVRDGEIVRASLYWEIVKFSPQMWEPFAEWVSTSHPEDAAVMYNETLSEYRLSEESIRLWERHSRGYAEIGRLSRIVEGVPFSFSVPTSGWERGPVERLPDGGFRNGSLYISKSTVGPQGAEAVVFWTSFPDGNDADPCANLLSPPVGPSAADLAGAVATAPGTELVTGPSDVAVGGHPAKHVVLTVREDVSCDPGFFYTWQDEMWGAFWPGTNVGDTIRVWIVDVDGTLLFIEAETTKQAGPRLEQEIRQIVESIRFD